MAIAEEHVVATLSLEVVIQLACSESLLVAMSDELCNAEASASGARSGIWTLKDSTAPFASPRRAAM